MKTKDNGGQANGLVEKVSRVSVDGLANQRALDRGCPRGFGDLYCSEAATFGAESVER